MHELAKHKDSFELLFNNVSRRQDLSVDTKNFISSFKTTMQLPEKHPELDSYLDRLNKWDFDVWGVPDDSLLVDMVVHILKEAKILERLKLDEETAREFVFNVRDAYRYDVPYHNFRHSFDVFHSVYLLYATTALRNYLGIMDIAAVLIAALIHDAGHDGCSNSFHINTCSHLALIYNDTSVLENYHCSLGYQIILKYKILSNLSQEEAKKFRNIVVEAILATDLSRHKLLLGRVQELQHAFDLSNGEHIKTLSVVLLKCADVSNPVKPFHIAKKWGESVQEEFFSQGDLERALGIPISKDMDRTEGSLHERQIRFIDNLVEPLYKALSKVIPDFSTYLETLMINRKQWTELREM